MKKSFKIAAPKYLPIGLRGLVISFFIFSISSSIAQTIKESEKFSALEMEMNKIAMQYGRQADVTLSHIKSLDEKVASSSDYAVLNAYRCFLSSTAKEYIIYQNTIKALKTKEAQSTHNLVTLAAIQAALGICDYYRETNEQKRELILSKAYYSVKASHAPTLRYWISLMYSDQTSRQGRAREAIEAATIALSVARSNNDILRQAESLRILSMIEVDLLDRENALAHINEAISLLSSANKTVNTEYFLNRAFILTQQKDYASALKAYREVEIIANKEGLTSIPSIVWSNYADIAYLQGNYSQAQFEVNRLLNWAHQNNDTRIASYANITASLLAIENKDINKAQLLFNEAISFFEKEKSYIEMRDFYHSLANAYARNGFYKQAFSALEKKVELGLKIEKESRGHSTNELRELLKTEEQKKENILLQAEIESNKLNIQRWGFLAAFLFLGILWFSQLFIQARRRNSLLQLENNELDTERYQDPLTLLYNRRYIIKNLSGIWQKTLQNNSAVLIIDADHFKQINDNYGHTVGDAALIEIARRIKLSVRETDIVVRWGGEEFVVFNFSCNAAQAQSLASRILEELRSHPFIFEDKTISLSASVGYVLLPLLWRNNENLNLEDSIKLADAALYLSKTRGRNRAIGIQSLSSNSSEVTQLIESLQPLWDNDEVDLIEILGPQN